MENTINYKEENENLRLRIELSKQRENELRMEKEVILLRKQNENPSSNIKPKPKVIKKQKSKVKINFKPKVIKSKPLEIKEPINIVKEKAQEANEEASLDRAIEKAKAKAAEEVDSDTEKKEVHVIAPIKKINTKHEKKLILEAEKQSKPITLDDIKEMLENKKNDVELYKETKKELIERNNKRDKELKEGINYIHPKDEVDEFNNDDLGCNISVENQSESERLCRYSQKGPAYLDVKNQLLTVERKNEIILNIKKGTLEIEPYIKPEIYEKDRTPKHYIKQYELKIILTYVENQLILNSKLVYDTLLKDLKRNDGLKVNIVLNLKVDITKGDDKERIYSNMYVSSQARIIINKEELLYFSTGEDMWDKYINIGAEGSGNTIDSVLNHYINVYKYLPLKGGSYIEMPDKF